MTAAALILAAGFSTRMGQCKASLPWGDRHTLLTYQIEQLLEAGALPVVVLGQHNANQQARCSEAYAIAINPDAARGKVSSIHLGLSLLPDHAETLLISAVDQPRPAWIYKLLLAAHASAQSLGNPPPITAPVRGDRLGHPLLFDRTLIASLNSIQEETLGLRSVVSRYREQIQRVAFDTDLVLADLNTPGQYRQTIADQSFEAS